MPRSRSHDSAMGDSDNDDLPDVHEIVNNNSRGNRSRSHAAGSRESTDDEHEEGQSRRRTRATTAAAAAPELAAENEVSLTDLDEDQRKVVMLAVQRGANICVIGRAGTGKSTVINALRREADKAGIRVRLAAPSGTTALNIGGQTIHAFAGLGYKMNHGIQRYEERATLPALRSRLTSTDMLIVDEISMISSELLERLDRVLKAARDSVLPFGGVQLVLIGDPCQLPPVQPFEYCMECGRKRADGKNGFYECEVHGKVHMDQQWVWKAPAFQAVEFKFVELKVSHRQQEPEFQAILDAIYHGRDLSDDDIARLENPELEDGAVELFPRKQDVRKCNTECFDDLVGRDVKCRSQDHYIWRKELHPDLQELTRRSNDGSLIHLGQHQYERELEMKIDMPVMLLRNLDADRGLVNGSQGIIKAWKTYTESDLVTGTTNPSDPDADCETQRPANAQGDRPVYGSIMANIRLDQIKKFMENKRRPRKIPIVKFHNGVTEAIMPDCSITEYGFEQPRTLLMRTQFPLIAAWAMTIHKAQGMTLDKVIGDASRVWCHGQLYVLLSRTRLMSGLSVEGLRKCKVSGRDQQVDIFLRSINWE